MSQQTNKRCLDCRHCQTQALFYGGTRYMCAADSGKEITSTAVSRWACNCYEAPSRVTNA